MMTVLLMLNGMMVKDQSPEKDLEVRKRGTQE